MKEDREGTKHWQNDIAPFSGEVIDVSANWPLLALSSIHTYLSVQF